MLFIKNINNIILVLCFFLTTIVFSQTKEEVREITKTYNISNLKTLEKTLKEQELTAKNKALVMAETKGWPVTYTEDGSFHELMSLTKDNQPIYYKTTNVNAAISTRANFLNNGGGLGLNIDGQGMTAHVWDGGPGRTTHQEFDGQGGANRLSVGDGSGSGSDHGTHVTGTIIASGYYSSAKGMAPQAKAVGYDWNTDETEATSAAANGMLLSNHSYGYDADQIPDYYFGAYLGLAKSWDEIMYNAPFYLQVTSAGNDGNNGSANANPLEGNSLYDKLSGMSTAKNNLVVANGRDANIDSEGNLISVSINSSSSEGPTNDLRIKPDIMGNGTSLVSPTAGSDSAYGNATGTSMSAPNVTGSLLLLQQYYNNINGSFMKAATLKGLALHTADDTGDEGPDAKVGWGLMNTKKAAETIFENEFTSVISEEVLSEGSTFTMTVKSDGTNPLKASISWTDAPGSVASGAANDDTPVLVNDLDIQVSQNEDIFQPWKLTSVNSNTKGDNSVDPYERVDIEGASGVYTITVTHKGTLENSLQNFSLIITGTEKDFNITSVNSPILQCSDSEAVFNFNYTQTIETTTNFSFQNLPTGASGSFSPQSLSADGSFTLTISDLENVAAGTYDINIIGDNGTDTQTKKVKLRVLRPDFTNTPMTPLYPANLEIGVLFPEVILQWNENINAESYTYEISDNPSFTNIIATRTVTNLEATVIGLTENTVYYWRVNPINQCGTFISSEIFSFQTAGSEECSNTYTATDFTNASIRLSASALASIPIIIDDDLTISRMTVNLDITHEAVGELHAYIQEPAVLGSNTISLFQNVCGATANVTNAIFDDTGSVLTCNPSDPAITGAIIPLQNLSSSLGKSSLGTWLLEVSDDVLNNGGGTEVGNVNSASITVCTATANTSFPDFMNNTVSVVANGTTTITSSDISASSTNETPSQQVYTIVSSPTKGDITKNGVVLEIGDTYTQEDVNLGNIAFINTETTLFTDSFKVDITNLENGWLPNQVINIEATTLSIRLYDLSKLLIYPIPSKEELSVQFETQSNDQVKIALFDLQGRRVFSSNYTSNQQVFNQTINIGRLSNGVYLLKATQGNQSTTKRVIISK